MGWLKIFLETNPYFGFWPIVSYFLAAIIGVVIGVIFSPMIENFITWILSKTFLKYFFRKKKTIDGIWTHDWYVDSARFDTINTSKNVRLKKIGRKVFAKYNVTDKSGEVYTYIMNGKIDSDNYITGDWYDINAGNTYYGTFQLHININVNSMSGFWIGKSQDQKVKSGKWEWLRE